MTNTTQATVRVHRVYINAPAQKVWDAITSPEWNGRYAFKAPSEYDLRPGGAYRVVSTAQMREFGAPEVLIDGEVLECEVPTRLVQTWRAHFTPETSAEGFTRLTWELRPTTNAGETSLLFRHSGFGNDYGDEQHAHVNWVWGQIVGRLKAYAETGQPQPFFAASPA